VYRNGRVKVIPPRSSSPPTTSRGQPSAQGIDHKNVVPQRLCGSRGISTPATAGVIGRVPARAQSGAAERSGGARRDAAEPRGRSGATQAHVACEVRHARSRPSSSCRSVSVAFSLPEPPRAAALPDSSWLFFFELSGFLIGGMILEHGKAGNFFHRTGYDAGIEQRYRIAMKVLALAPRFCEDAADSRWKARSSRSRSRAPYTA